MPFMCPWHQIICKDDELSWKHTIDLVMPKQDGLILWSNPIRFGPGILEWSYIRKDPAAYLASVKITLDYIQKFFFIWIIYRRPKGFFDIHRSTDERFYVVKLKCVTGTESSREFRSKSGVAQRKSHQK